MNSDTDTKSKRTADGLIRETGKCNDDSNELPNIKSIPESLIYYLADIVTDKKVLSNLSDMEKY